CDVGCARCAGAAGRSRAAHRCASRGSRRCTRAGAPGSSRQRGRSHGIGHRSFREPGRRTRAAAGLARIPQEVTMQVRRRGFLAGTGALLLAPRVLFAQAATDRRFVFVIQRGAADGLNTVVPYADPAYASLRGPLAIDASSAIRVDGSFALHPSLQEFGKLHAEGQALFVHAVASPYRDRSHFDGQNVLESGGTAPYQLKDGWMNRLVGQLPKRAKEAIAFAPTVPLALRGAAEVTSYAPSALPAANDDLLIRVQQLYEADPQLHGLWSAAMD